MLDIVEDRAGLARLVSIETRSRGMTQAQMTQLAERLGGAEFAMSLEADALGTLRESGFEDLVLAAEEESERIAELIDRIYTDDEFRALVEEDPSGRLSEWGIPELAIEPLLSLAGAPDEVLERATADVEAHLSIRKPATLAAAVALLGTLAFAQEASASLKPAQVKPAVSAQVKQEVLPQVGRAVVKPAFQRAVANSQARSALVTWKGLNVQRATQLGIASLVGQ
jgi:hypothetical protein